MTRPRRCAFALIALLAAGCSPREPAPLQGYVEGEFVLVAAPGAGVLQSLRVRRGDAVPKGATVFELDHVAEDAAQRQAAQIVRTAEERLSNLRGARRAPEIAAVSAQREQARAVRELSTQQLRQQERLFRDGFISQAQLDAAHASFDRDSARLAETEAQARLSQQSIGRDPEIRAAAADAEAARAAFEQARWRLTQRSATAPADALVQDTYFVEGEWVPAGRPVASLLPPGNVKVRFWVPEPLLGRIHPGDRVSVHCDGCPAAFAARVSFISRQAEFTPPVIYSRESRARLVFMIEARPDPADALRLRPGQPVDVRLQTLPEKPGEQR